MVDAKVHVWTTMETFCLRRWLRTDAEHLRLLRSFMVLWWCSFGIWWLYAMIASADTLVQTSSQVHFYSLCNIITSSKYLSLLATPAIWHENLECIFLSVIVVPIFGILNISLAIAVAIYKRCCRPRCKYFAAWKEAESCTAAESEILSEHHVTHLHQLSRAGNIRWSISRVRDRA